MNKLRKALFNLIQLTAQKRIKLAYFISISGVSLLHQTGRAGWGELLTTIYIYIYSNLISTSIHGTRKKNPGQEQEKKVSRITAQGKKKKKFGSKRKKRPTSSDPLKKIKGYAVSGQKKTKKPSANPAMLQLLKCSTPDNGANYKINLNRESKIFY